VRYISNESSGTMGFAVAAAAAARGHRVTLVHGPVALPAPAGVRCIPVVSAADMLAACRKVWPRHNVLIMVAAVADYTPAKPLKRKRKKSAADLVLRLKPTVDILATLSQSRDPDQVTIGFALEDANARRNAAEKLQRKKLDAIVLNGPAALGSKRASWEVLLGRGGDWMRFHTTTKSRLAARLVGLAESLQLVAPPRFPNRHSLPTLARRQ
jgi:phosphopantothenoylcysteine decarboxylase/phosphopantothenate--cysteine ligase